MDPFGFTRVRRTERELIEEYRTMIEGLLPALNEESYKRCTELASMPDMVRGYEDIKLANVAKYRAQVKDLTADLLSAASQAMLSR